MARARRAVARRLLVSAGMAAELMKGVIISDG
jgi:hypothetical protein